MPPFGLLVPRKPVMPFVVPFAFLMAAPLSASVMARASPSQPHPTAAVFGSPANFLGSALSWFLPGKKGKNTRQSLSVNATASRLPIVSLYLAGLGRTRRRLAPLQGQSANRSVPPLFAACPFRFSRRRFFLLSPTAPVPTISS